VCLPPSLHLNKICTNYSYVAWEPNLSCPGLSHIDNQDPHSSFSVCYTRRITLSFHVTNVTAIKVCVLGITY
jgi:hypothetical protein